MGYAVELGYQDVDGSFEVARVASFSGGSIVAIAEGDTSASGLTITKSSGLEYDPFSEPSAFLPTAAVDDAGRMDAILDVTANYSQRIIGITGEHLSAIRRMRAAEASATFIRLIIGLRPEEPDFNDYYNPTDGNIRFMAQTLLGWTFQHPDAIFDVY